MAGVGSWERALEVQALRARIGLCVKMLTNAGYAMIGGAVFKAIPEERAVPPASWLWAGAGVAALFFAIGFAPHGKARQGWWW